VRNDENMKRMFFYGTPCTRLLLKSNKATQTVHLFVRLQGAGEHDNFINEASILSAFLSYDGSNLTNIEKKMIFH